MNNATFTDKKAYRFSAMAVASLLVISGIMLTDAKASSNFNKSNNKAVNVDKIDYPFINDPKVIGKQESVDFVQNMDSFNPDKKSWEGDLYLSNLTFDENGKIHDKNITWTKDLVLDANNKTASKYTIKEINGSKYMFFEWKNGDYIERGATPWYYVLKQ